MHPIAGQVATPFHPGFHPGRFVYSAAVAASFRKKRNGGYRKGSLLVSPTTVQASIQIVGCLMVSSIPVQQMMASM